MAIQNTQFAVRQDSFDGPLDLLLSLVEERKLFVNEVSLAAVADDFIAYVEKKGGVAMAETASFVFTASTLLLVKARSLLPNISLTDEESASVQDLEDRLCKLADIHTKTALLEKMCNIRPLFRRGIHLDNVPVFSPPREKDALIPARLGVLFRELIARIPRLAEDLPRIAVKQIVSLETVIASLTERIEHGIKLSFKNLRGSSHTKEGRGETIVSFLALLELVRRGMALARQEAHFDDIQIESRKINTPHYG